MRACSVAGVVVAFLATVVTAGEDAAAKADQKKVQQVTIKGNVYSGVFTDNHEKFRSTGPVADFQVKTNWPGNLTAMGDRLFFTADDPYAGYEMWTSDGPCAVARCR